MKNPTCCDKGRDMLVVETANGKDDWYIYLNDNLYLISDFHYCPFCGFAIVPVKSVGKEITEGHMPRKTLKLIDPAPGKAPFTFDRKSLLETALNNLENKVHKLHVLEHLYKNFREYKKMEMGPRAIAECSSCGKPINKNYYSYCDNKIMIMVCSDCYDRAKMEAPKG